jgi:hypothetical protein
MRPNNQTEADLTGAPGKLLVAAVVAFGVIAFSAYGFATGDQPKPIAAHQSSSAEIRTTPDNSGQRELPPPVAPSKSE